MIKRGFIGLRTPWLAYDQLSGVLPALVQVPTPAVVRLRQPDPYDSTDKAPVKPGTILQTGQRLNLREGSPGYVLATISGTVTELSGVTGLNGQPFTELTIAAAGTETQDESFGALCATPTLDMALDYLRPAPGAPPLAALAMEDKPIHTVVINAVEEDLLCHTRQYVLKTGMESLSAGIAVLRRIAAVETIVLVVPQDALHGHGHIGATVKSVSRRYPSGHPRTIMRTVLGIDLRADMQPEDLGVLFMGVEAVVSIGRAFGGGQIPQQKVITLVDKEGRRTLVGARIGTPVGQVLATAGITLQERDRLVLGGPMRGQAIFSLDHPVMPDTDGILVQGAETVSLFADYPCINCGECVRICPTRVPVNILVRYLEARAYAAAADEYDLDACIECGLCTWVCVARIPIFQHIMLAKQELARAQAAEVVHEQ